MLSAFVAQPIHSLKPKDKSRIEALLAYGDRLLVGLSTGALRIYRVLESSTIGLETNGNVDNDDDAKKNKAVELLREEEKFSRRPVQQLAIVKEANLLVSLSDGYISLHDLQSYELIERLERTKGATYFTVTSNVVREGDTEETKVASLVSRLAVAVKRRLLIWTWQDMEQLSDVQELSLEASAKSLVWVTGTRALVGMDPGYVLVNVENGEQIPIYKPAGMKSTVKGQEDGGELAGVRFGAVSSSGMGYMGMGSWVPKPMATRLSDNEVLLAKDVNSLFCDADGKPSEKRQIPWHLAPEAIGYSYPYLLALQPPEKGTLQIRNPETLTLLQTISVPQAYILHVPQPNISLAHLGKGFLVASDRTIWRMNGQGYVPQLEDLVEKQRFDEAISLLQLLEDTLIDDKAGRIRETKIQKATALFYQQKYRPALDLFTEAEAPPDRVIALYPKNIAGELSSIPDVVDSSDEPATTEQDQKQDDPQPPSTPSKGMLATLRGHKRNESDTASVRSVKNDNDPASPRRKLAPKPSDRPLEGNDLRQACLALNSFLPQARVRIKDYLNLDGTLKVNPPELDSETGRPAFAHLLPDAVFEKDSKDSKDINWQDELLKVAKLVDTTLFRSYMFASPSLAGSLFRIDNFCDPEVVQAALYESERYNDLLDFLHGKRLHRHSLEMLAKFGKGEIEHGVVPEGLEGPRRTVAYLKQVPPELVDVILEFVQWPIEVDPDLGMEVFLEDSRNAEELPKDRVLAFLADFDHRLEEAYLEHIINELGDQNTEFHQRLLDVYIEDLKDLSEAGKEHDARRRQQVQSKLEAFLRKSKQYNKGRALQAMPKDSPAFFESRALVLAAIGNHRQALAIYVFQLQDAAKAEAYCNQVYSEQQADKQACLIDETHTHSKPVLARSETEDAGGSANVYAMLLGLYLRPPAGEEKRWSDALEFLSKHGARLPASSTLDLMPDDLAIKELEYYFRGRIRNATSVLREAKVIASLEGVRKSHVERVLLLGPDGTHGPGGRNKRVTITEDAHCRVCHRRFGASAVKVYPNGEVVHYGCVPTGSGKAVSATPTKARTALRNTSNGWG